MLTFDFRRFIKFCIVGTSGFFVNQFFLWFLTEILGIYYIFSSIFAIELAIGNNFFWNNLWTFKDRKVSDKKKIVKRFVKYNITCWGGDSLNVIILYILTEFFGIYYLVSNIIGILIAVIAKYSISFSWVFKKM